MSWIYTIVFAGLMFSSHTDGISGTQLTIQPDINPPAVVMSDETEKFEQTYPLNANGRVSVSNVNGSITVEAWDRNEVKLEYTKMADTKERLADVEVRIDAKPEHFSVETDYGMSNNRNWKNGGKLNVEMRLMVPRGAALNEVETVNGSVTVSNFVNVTKVSAVNGSVTATNLRGTANLSTVNGQVIADFDRLETGSRISLETVNGKVNLTIPSDANATVKADSLNGNITNDFGLPVRKGKYVGRDLYGRIGTGDVQIKLNSVNGGLSIGRKSDGKSPSPATNLLPQKEKDEQDWDTDNDESKIPSAVEFDKDVAKAMKAAEKDTTRAMRQTQRELERVQPELAKIEGKLINKEKLRQQIREASIMRRDIMAQMSNANFMSAVPRIEKKSNTFTVKGVPSVTVNAKGCAVSVKGWDKPEVQYTATQLSDARIRSAIKIDESHTDKSVTIGVDSTSEGGGQLRLLNDPDFRIEIYVPRKSDLKITTDGAIRIEGVSGEVELKGADEAINVRDLDGTLRVTNADGRIRVVGFRGELEAKTVDGAINLEGDFRKLSAKGVDGDIVLTLPEDASAELEATGDGLQGEGIAMVRTGGDENRSRYKIGKGGTLYQLSTNGGIRVRSANNLTTF